MLTAACRSLQFSSQAPPQLRFPRRIGVVDRAARCSVVQGQPHRPLMDGLDGVAAPAPRVLRRDADELRLAQIEGQCGLKEAQKKMDRFHLHYAAQ